MKTLYARVCDITGEGMNEGFCILNGETATDGEVVDLIYELINN